MTETQTSVNQKVKLLIENSGKTRSEVAKLLNVRRQQITEWCTEGKSVGKKTIDRLLSIFPEVGYGYFYDDDNTQVSEPITNYTKSMDLRTQSELLLMLSQTVREMKDRISELEKRLSMIEEPSKKKLNAGS